MSNLKNIVFDLGGVLIDWDPRQVYRTIFDTEEEVERFLTHVCKMEWNVQQDAGRSLAEATEVLQKEHPQWHDEIAAYYGRWEEMLVGPIEGTVEILKELVADDNYRVVALTNWSAETFPVAQDRYDFLQWFEGILVSGEEGCIKPDPKIYELLFERYNLLPQESLFVDDNAHNVEGSKALGMDAVRFKSAEQLRSVLEQRGILKVKPI